MPGMLNAVNCFEKEVVLKINVWRNRKAVV